MRLHFPTFQIITIASLFESIADLTNFIPRLHQDSLHFPKLREMTEQWVPRGAVHRDNVLCNNPGATGPSHVFNGLGMESRVCNDNL